ncbi:DUF3899 domain-containing protein [Staphylococcus sp. SQ8-PEA]|uniref:DUF3899 domain-containing protein n=1 Tax=Staphylococcus marylandisciuri TaxID=2981529 RepID=A0ABT2QPS7_9STAP|nr:DUF3899 domain-containing protein [Staphylococcus marylandisciuri]MCU5745981.1 DUF3899 domain-containing protein [Staphylococcus marylandisciuri]
MRFKEIGFFIFLTPILTLLLWALGTRDFLSYINILFYIATILAIVFFCIIILQEGVLDATSYGMRRLKYQLSSHKKQREMKSDEFFNPTSVKKDRYFVSSWVKTAFVINSIYFCLSIIISILL